MKSESLVQVLAAEKSSPNEWQELPHHYIEIAKLLFTKAEEDFAEFEMDVHEVSFGCGSKRALAAFTLLPHPTAPALALQQWRQTEPSGLF